MDNEETNDILDVKSPEVLDAMVDPAEENACDSCQ